MTAGAKERRLRQRRGKEMNEKEKCISRKKEKMNKKEKRGISAFLTPHLQIKLTVCMPRHAGPGRTDEGGNDDDDDDALWSKIEKNTE